MQTFLPYSDFKKSAEVLDYKRLGKMRVESMQILNSLRLANGWKNHPAVLMWKGYENSLKLYHNIMIQEWVKRGYNNNMSFFPIYGYIVFPHWLGNNLFHSSHRAALLFKNYNYYSQFNWEEKPEIKYFWPTKNLCRYY